MAEMMEDLSVESSDHHLSSGCIILGMKVIGLNSLKNLLLTKRSGELEARLTKFLLTPEITKGKDVSLKVEIQNEERLQILIDLKDSLYVKEASEATSSQSVRFAYCAERRKWFWTPNDKNHIWMEVSHESVQSGSRKGEIPEEKYLKVIRFLRTEKPILERRNTDCNICA
ncbi:uncharacterized protein LOC106160515 [Lingula anatina]|uniref:Uncharacterized protein LOC106160515 n=1 Tax=Lingula anatina TaxID=7574 RepID=A0A1S3I5F0_LINAN|nr:uncharacterized protein LOC106160515 [Lingula anatina]|eukprot:XP_013392589.1 uncharacterized protein LOC106160515 [Lingula anatina]